MPGSVRYLPLTLGVVLACGRDSPLVDAASVADSFRAELDSIDRRLSGLDTDSLEYMVYSDLRDQISTFNGLSNDDASWQRFYTLAHSAVATDREFISAALDLMCAGSEDDAALRDSVQEMLQREEREFERAVRSEYGDVQLLEYMQVHEDGDQVAQRLMEIRRSTKAEFDDEYARLGLSAECLRQLEEHIRGDLRCQVRDDGHIGLTLGRKYHAAAGGHYGE